MNISKVRPFLNGLYIRQGSCPLGMFQISRCKSSKQMFSRDSNPQDYDLVGPQDSKSNIRKMIFSKKPHETRREQELRLQKQALHSWHQEFWTKHNENFNKEHLRRYFNMDEPQTKNLVPKRMTCGLKWENIRAKSKKKFLAERSMKENESDKEFADDLSVFYKDFLDKNSTFHRDYLWEWYKRNLKLVLPSFIITVEQLKNWLLKKR